jgi:hypothetical protein
MFCPKCGTQNPETGKFCRSCGTDLGNVTDALSGKIAPSAALYDRKGKPIGWEGAITKLFMGLGFVVVSIVLGVSGAGRGWWFWMLIPGFMFVGTGLAQMIQLKKAESGVRPLVPHQQQNASIGSAAHAPSLPPTQTPYISPAESRYKTGDLVPPSVTEGTTRHLEADPEGETMTLPKL